MKIQYINTYLNLFFLTGPCNMWCLSSPSMDQTRAPCSGVEVQSLKHSTAREVPLKHLLGA